MNKDKDMQRSQSKKNYDLGLKPATFTASGLTPESSTPTAGTMVMAGLLSEYTISKIHPDRGLLPSDLRFLELTVTYRALKLKGSVLVSLDNISTVREFYPTAKKLLAEILKDNRIVLDALIAENETI